MQANALRLGVEPDAAARARAHAAEVLAPELPELLDDAQLVLTELVTNAQLHGTPPIEVRVLLVEGGVRVEVQDASRQMLVIPTQSPDAMTGRGLALVAALAASWGVDPDAAGGKVVWAELSLDRASTAAEAPDVDPEAFLVAWDDEADLEPMYEVRLGSVPTELLLDAKRHIDNVVRELTLERASIDVAPELAALIETVTQDFALARAGIKRQAAEAAGRGDVETELVLHLPVSSIPAGERYLAALDEADRYARDARLLTLETPPLHRVFRRWYVQALVEQLRQRAAGDAPVLPRRFVQVLSDEVTALSQLRDQAHRLVVLQRVNAELARARSASEMADVVIRTAEVELGAQAARVYVVDGDAIRAIAIAGGPAEWAHRYEKVPLQADLPGPLAVSSGAPVVLHGSDQISSRFPALRGLYPDERSLVVAPLTAGDHRLGVFSVSAPLEGRIPREEVAAFVQALADALAQALDRTDEVTDPIRAVPAQRRDVDYLALFRALPTSYMVMDRGLVYVDANDAYLASVGRSRDELIGRHVFDVFPPTPDALDPRTGKSRVQLSFERARDSGRPDTMPAQKYDIPNPSGPGFVERYWSLISVPIRGADGQVALIAQRAEDITDFVRERERNLQAEQDSAGWRRRVEEVEADLFGRAQELEAAIAAKDRTAERLAGLASVALQLTAVDTVPDLARVVFDSGLPVLGGDGGAISVRDDDAGVVRLEVSESLGEQAQRELAVLPLDSALPAAHVARTGRPVLFPSRAAGLAWSSETEALYAATDRSAWATLPLRVGDALLGALVVAWREEQQLDAEDMELLEAFAAQVAQALQRIRVTAAQREAALAAQRMSETLQRSLLTDPPQPPGLRLAVRYAPAAAEAHVGGDWYDAFVTAAGSTLLVIGDVTGHDRAAAAAMGQVRNLLRGLAYDSDSGPARLVTRLDTAMLGLDIGVLATALLARVERDGDAMRLRWANAGHPPPVLREPDGTVRVLDTGAELMLGVLQDVERSEHVVDLGPGATVVLFTDGLVERRDRDLDTGIGAVADVLRRAGSGDPESVADALLDLVDEGTNADDVALLVLRVQG